MHAIALLQEAGTQSNPRVREKRELGRDGRKTMKGSVLPMLSFIRKHIHCRNRSEAPCLRSFPQHPRREKNVSTILFTGFLLIKVHLHENREALRVGAELQHMMFEGSKRTQ